MMRKLLGADWVGADPGGKNKFGLALLSASGEVSTACVSCADEAVAKIDSPPLGVGVDAPLWWSSGPSSDRKADQWIRKKYGIRSGTVQTANSLRGAALVQAAMFILRLREKFPAVRVTEAHPKAVALALGVGSWHQSRSWVVLPLPESMRETRRWLRLRPEKDLKVVGKETFRWTAIQANRIPRPIGSAQ